MSEWVRIVSWHLVKRVSSDGPVVLWTLCGRWAAAGAEQTNDRPQGKTCETCLRIKVGR